MDLYDTLSLLKMLVDNCEEIIREGKLAIATKDTSLAMKFVSSVRSMIPQIRSVLAETRNIVEKHNAEDTLLKYISVYYRTLTLISIPYMILILKELRGLLDEHGRNDRINELQDIIMSLESAVSTLKQR